MTKDELAEFRRELGETSRQWVQQARERLKELTPEALEEVLRQMLPQSHARHRLKVHKL